MPEQLIYITKYALTRGILTYPKDRNYSLSSDYVVVKDKNGLNGTSMYGGNDWHTTEEAAKKRAEQMRVDRIASLKKQVKTLETLKF